MKKLNVIVFVSSLALLASGHAMADEYFKKGASNQQFSGQRPFMKAPVQDSTYSANDKWEGATLVVDQEATSKKATSQQALRLNMMAKRTY